MDTSQEYYLIEDEVENTDWSMIQASYDNKCYSLEDQQRIAVLNALSNGMSMLPKIGTVIAKIPDPFYFRMILEIFADFICNTKLRFTQDGIHMHHANKDETATIAAYISEENLLSYERHFIDHRYKDNRVVATVNLKTTTKMLKAYGKKGEINLAADISTGGKVPEILSQLTRDEYQIIPCDMNSSDDDNYEVVNQLEKHYGGTAPDCKMKMSALLYAFNKCKVSGCTQIQFILLGDSIVIAQLRGGIQVGADRYSKTGESLALNNISEHTYISAGADYVIQNYTVNVNFSKYETWMTKIAKLANGNSIASIYMREGLPVVISVNISFLGHAIFSFVDDKKC